MRLTAALVLPSLLVVPMASAQTPPAPKQPVNIVVFSDLQCPYSADLFFRLEHYRQTHPGQLHVTYKQSPLDIHPTAPLAHRAVLAAALQGRSDAMAELLYANQEHQELATILADARQLRLDLPRFRRDLDSAAVKERLAADMAESEAFGIQITPTLYIQGKVLTGVQTEAALTAAIAGAATPPADTADSDAASTPVDPALLGELERSPSAQLGPANAPLTIVEFTDFQCPFCRAAVQPLEQFVAAHPGNVRLIIRSFPLDFHPDSELANEAALAAGEQGKFWQMHDLLFAHQDALKQPDLRDYAQQLHLDMTAFDEALFTHRLAGRIAADRALGVKANVGGTPTFIVDGQTVTGARSVPEWEQFLAQRKTPTAAPQVVVAAVPPAAAKDRVVSGPTGAPLTLTWYTDVRGTQAAAQAELVRSLSKRYDGKVRIVFKAYPLDTHPDGRLAAAALAAAASQQKFWPMYDALTAHKSPLDRAGVIVLATSLQLDAVAFTAALDAAPEAVQTDIDEAQRRGILGAPVIFLNDRRVDGLQREAFYTAIADDILKPASTTQGSVVAPPPFAPASH